MLHCVWSGHVGGAQRAVYQLVREQLREGSMQPGVLFGQSGRPYWDRMVALGCPTLDAQLPSGRSFSRVGAVAELMRPFDLLHFHGTEPVYIMASLRCQHHIRVYTQRGGLAASYPLAQAAALRRSSERCCGAAFTVCRATATHGARAAGELFGIPAARFAVTYNGIEFDLLEPTRPPAEVRSELGLPPDSFVLGTASTLKGWKRVDRLVHALAAVDRPELRLLVVGDGAERRRLEELVDRLGVRSRTLFVGLQTDVANLVQGMDAFCLPSNGRESFGNAAVEAMALGVPTIVFADGGGTTEHIDDGKTGFIVADDAELHETLIRLLDDPRLCRSIGAAGRIAVRERYTPAAAARRYEQLYAAAAAAAASARAGS